MQTHEPLHEAILWESADEGRVRCLLCSHRCMIPDGHTGRCCVRRNVGGTLYTLVYDKICAAHADPIEKKPLFHFLPGSRSFSIATQGCNFQCVFCQNWQISQTPADYGRIEGEGTSPEQIVDAAVRTGCRSIAYTYTEPTIFMELAADCARLAKDRGLANVFVSNGYMTTQAVDYARGWLDAINVDLKAFRDDTYRTLCKARLKPVMEGIQYIARETDIWIEVTTLLVPGQNDSEEELKELAQWLATEAGAHVPWHISRFYPQYKFTDAQPTPIAALERAYEIGRAAGLHYVYLGNVPGSKTENTFCHHCGRVLIERIGYTVGANYVQQDKCPDCGTAIAGAGLA